MVKISSSLPVTTDKSISGVVIDLRGKSKLVMRRKMKYKIRKISLAKVTGPNHVDFDMHTTFNMPINIEHHAGSGLSRSGPLSIGGSLTKPTIHGNVNQALGKKSRLLSI